MQITEVRVKLMEDQTERLKAFCSITFDDCFVIRDLKIIEGTNGPFVAMPSRKLTSHCPVCRYKNHIRAAFCNQCGTHLREQEPFRDEDGRAKLYADIAHPINSACREMIQREVIAAFEEEKVRAQTPGYVSKYDDYDSDFEITEVDVRMSVTEFSESQNNEKSQAENTEKEIGTIHESDSSDETRGPHLGFGRERVSDSVKNSEFGTGIFEEE
ncbi:MAG: SpoVG family protein [Planctomycetia bacterium]|nr:SpoVG family protein [Planctomycetia bacterium]